MTGVLVISLDFELMWGIRHQHSVEAYRRNILGARQAIPAMLDLFREYEIHATWATVGLLFFSDKADMVRGTPRVKPAYQRSDQSGHNEMESVGQNESLDPYHFGQSLIQMIRKVPGQEIGSHTFSHYFCLEPGQDGEAFRADLEAANRAAEALGLHFHALVFPRNQINPAYLDICVDAGFKCYRGTEKAWFYSGNNLESESLGTRVHRLLDAYVNIFGHNTYAPQRTNGMVDLRASRFLRPYHPKLAALDSLKFRRIASGIREAARQSQIYHLWWHPHNFGVHLSENIAFLRKVLDSFREMRDRHGMQSLNMGEAAQLSSHAR